MNRIFKVVFNKVLGVFTAASELAKTGREKSVKAALLTSLLVGAFTSMKTDSSMKSWPMGRIRLSAIQSQPRQRSQMPMSARRNMIPQQEH